MSTASSFFGAQGTVPVGTVLPINSRDNLYIGADKTEWLRSGVVELDVAAYPHAFIGYEGGGAPIADASRFTLDDLTVGQLGYTVGGITGQVDIAWDGEGKYWYVLEQSTNIVYQFTEQGVSTGISFNLTADALVLETTFKGIAFHGGRLYAVGTSTDKGYRFRPDGTYDALQFVLNVGGGSQTQPVGIAVHDDGIYVVCADTNKISKYGLGGVYLGIPSDILVSGQLTNPAGLAISDDGLKLFVIDSVLGKVFRYTSAGYDNFNFLPNTQDTTVAGIDTKGIEIHVHGQENNFVYKYDAAGNYKIPMGDTVVQPRGIYFEEATSLYYVADTTNSIIYRFDSNLTYTGWSFNHNPTVTGETKPRGVTVIDGDFWVLDSNLYGTENEQGLYKYDSAGAFTGFFVDTYDVVVKPRDMASNGINMFVLSYEGDVYEYTPDGVYTGKTFDVKSNGIYWGAITYDATSNTLWLLCLDNDTLYQYDSGGNYTNNHFKTQSPIPVSFIIRADQDFEVMDSKGSGMVRLTKENGVGMLNASNDISGARNYVRIK